MAANRDEVRRAEKASTIRTFSDDLASGGATPAGTAGAKRNAAGKCFETAPVLEDRRYLVTGQQRGQSGGSLLMSAFGVTKAGQGDPCIGVIETLGDLGEGGGGGRIPGRGQKEGALKPRPSIIGRQAADAIEPECRTSGIPRGKGEASPAPRVDRLRIAAAA
ncbi:MAG TPA: hypothetical protein PLX84_03555, partial [Acidiphilium sp.]|nr:hypothetical protein [Acidiphilium sp.]